MERARSIVEAILTEITSRIEKQTRSHHVVDEFVREELHAIDDRIMLDFSHASVPPTYFQRIRETIGPDIIDDLEQNISGPLGRKKRERLHPLYKKLAVLIEHMRFFRQKVYTLYNDYERMKKIQAELVESQIGFVHEAEHYEQEVRKCEFLIDIVLKPFEEAMKQIVRFLEADHLEVFLFDDDQLLATELKTDGKTIAYHKIDEKPHHPEAVHEAVLHEIQEISLDMPLMVEGVQIGHVRVSRALTGGLSKEQWKEDVAWIAPVLARIIQGNRDRVLARKVYIDDLTQLYNKRKLNEQMGKLFNRFKQGEKELYIAMIDIDRFKNLNDTYGHTVGDEILRRSAAIIKEEVPYAYRYGGEEFAAVFYGYNREQTQHIMERLRRRIEQTTFTIDGHNYTISISAGIARFETYMHSVMDAINRADAALYLSKEDGRNRCTYYEDVKDRLTADVAQLRQELLRMKEQVAQYDRLQQENLRLAEELERERRKQRKTKHGILHEQES
ncbi:MAG: diguanylate cyclase [Desulfobacterota bacterium]|nr:diguanylate cyclase [Thermodesulfobacteriota bacterium]